MLSTGFWGFGVLGFWGGWRVTRANCASSLSPHSVQHQQQGHFVVTGFVFSIISHIPPHKRLVSAK